MENEALVAKRRQQVLDMSKLISQRQLVAGSWGNVSARIDKNTYAITPSGRPYATMVLEDIAVIDSHGQKLTGNYLPSSETKLHVAIYQKFPEAGGIIHTHSIYACVLAACHKDLPPIMEDLVQVLGGPVTCAKYALPGTEELAQNVVAAMEHTSAAFMANHGLVCWGRDVKEAYLISELVEKTARIYCKALALGPAQEISPEDAQIMHKFYLEHYSKRQRGEEKK